MCDKCQGTGLLPFIKPDGTVSKHVKVHCSCHPVYGDNPEPEHYHPVKSDDIDYPVSFSHYRALCQYHGWQDPGSDFPIELEHEKRPFIPRPVVNVTYQMGAEKTLAFTKLQEQINLLKGKLTKYFEDKKSKAQGKYGYRGIR